MQDKALKMPISDSPLSPILSWYNYARERANAPSLQVEAHYFGISLPRLRNIVDINRFDDMQIKLLDKYSIDLNVAARISHMNERFDEILTDDYLSNLKTSEKKLTELWLTKKGDLIDENDMMEIFINEGYCGKVYSSRIAKFGKGKTRTFEKMLQNILGSIARGREPSDKQRNVVFQAINQERDSSDFNWSSPSLKKNCPKSVQLVDNWDGR